MTMVPDWEQVGGLVHWGGRLMREQAWHLLLGNAIMLGGLVALIAEGVIGVVRRGLRAGDVGAGQATGLEGS